MNIIVKGILYLLLLIPFRLFASFDEPEFEEISVFVRVQGMGGFEINALYEYETSQLFLPPAELFQFLRIKCEVSPNQELIKGFIISEEKTYEIDYRNRTLFYDKNTFVLPENEILKTDLGLYLHSAIFGRIFGLHTTFNFRSLSVEVKTELELPAIREMRLEQLRKNIEQLRGEVEVDTTYSRDYHFLRFGMVDWAVSSTQYTRNPNDTRANIGIGAELLGGETNVFLNYSSRYGFSDRNQQYYWRWANNQTKLIKQVRIGKINPGTISSVYDPLVGVSITNAPTTYRRSFGEYSISDFTEPGWSVELYINNVLVDYQIADASGFYNFDVPLVYGSSQIMIKFFGPYGEERIKEQFINVPFNFLPKGELEYKVSGGIVMDDDFSRFGKFEASYGVNRFITVGGGYEYLSSIETGSEIPFISASIIPFRNLLFSGEYADGVRSKALVSYRLPSNLMFELDYTKYVPGQKAIRFNYLEERRATFASPLRFSFLKGYTRWSFRQSVYEMLTYNTADITFSAYTGRVNTNLTTYATWIEGGTPFIYGNLTGGIRLGRGYTIRPQSQFDITNKGIILVKAELEKRISRSGYISISAEENFRSAYRSIDFSLRWDLPFAQTNFSARYAGKEVTSTQGARGSFSFGSGKNYMHVDSRSAISRGGISLYPFLDLNHNGIRENDEPLVAGLTVRVNGGRILRNNNDTIIRVFELEPYTSYLVELDDIGFEEIAWQLVNKRLKVYIDPNQFKKVDVPVLPMGEANGWVYIEDQAGVRGQGRLMVNFFREDGTLIAKTMTESDGGFTYLGLPPGDIYAEIDSLQLSRLNMVADPPRINFSIEPLSYGDIVYDIEFTIRRTDLPEESHSSVINNASERDPVQITVNQEEEITSEFVTQDISIDPETPLERVSDDNENLRYFAIQAGAFSNIINANELKSKIDAIASWPIKVVSENRLVKVIVGQFQTLEEAQMARRFLMDKGIDCFVLSVP